MDRFMLHLSNKMQKQGQNSDAEPNKIYQPKDAANLLTKSRQLCSGMDVIIRDARVSGKFVELDVSIKKDSLDEMVKRLQGIGPLDHAKHVVEEKLQKQEAIKEGIFFFNTERFWECHEVFEGVWKQCHAAEKNLLQGIILVAAAFVHYQKAEDEICMAILGRALQKLEEARAPSSSTDQSEKKPEITGTYHDIDINKLQDAVLKIRDSGQIATFMI